MTRSRREFLRDLGIGTVAVSMLSLPNIASPPSNASPFLKANWGRMGFSPEDEFIQYGDEKIAVHVPYDESKKDNLEDWVDSDDGRDIIGHNDAIETVTIRLPVEDVSAGLLSSSTLGDLPYLDADRELDANFQVSIPEPVDLDERPTNLLSFDGLESWVLSFYGWSSPSTAEVAYDDAEVGTVAEAVGVTGAAELPDSVGHGTLSMAVIDTGLNHADGDVFGDTNRILPESKNYTTSDEPTVADGGLEAIADGNGHGTHVTSTIAADPLDEDHAADYRGYLPDADLLILKALDDDGQGSTNDIARAVTYAADQGADLICMSLGSPIWSVELERALSYAVGASSIPFVAGGNNRSSPQPFVNSPADAPNAITVAAGEVREAAETRGGHFSAVGPDPGTVNFSDGETEGAAPDIAAPGVELEALVVDSRGRVEAEALSGTSMAAPCVIGGAGLVLADGAVENDHEKMLTKLTEYAEPAPKFGVEEAGAGWLDVQAAIDETESDETQADTRTNEAEARDEAWRSLSEAYGGTIARYLL